MISHQYKCIFVHIPRIAGTSLEHWISDSDWWSIEKETKHLIASQAKAIYHDYWDEYFKFSFVRNPWDRVISSLKCKEYFGIYHQKNHLRSWKQRLDFKDYKSRFGGNITLEHDHRFYKREDLVSSKHCPGQIYGNMLDEQLDFIGTYENLEDDCYKIQQIIGIDKKMTVHAEKSTRKDYRRYFDRKSIDEVRNLYAKDIELYDYKY